MLQLKVLEEELKEMLTVVGVSSVFFQDHSCTEPF